MAQNLALIQQKMVEKNFNIKQRAVNETPAFSGIHSQNLFKLPHEYFMRTKLLMEPVTQRSQPSSTRGGDQEKKRVPRNISIELLRDTDSEYSEADVKTEAQLIADYEEGLDLGRDERKCATNEEFRDLLDRRAQKVKREQSKESSKSMKQAMGKVFKHAQKIVELKQGLNFDHFVKIGRGVTNPQRLIGEILL